MTPITVVRVRSTRDVLVPVVADYILSHLGFFTVLPVLPLVVQRLANGSKPVFVGAVLFIFTFAIRGASLFCAPLIHRALVNRSMSLGLCLASVGFFALAVEPPAPVIPLCLVLAGSGISINGLAARVFVAKMLARTVQRSVVFASVQVAVNVVAAVGPLIGNLLFGRGLVAWLLVGVATMYLAAAATVALMIPSGLRPSEGAMRTPARARLFRDILRDRVVRRLSALAATSAFLYAQFFSAVALHVVRVTSSSVERAAVFVLNAVCVAVLQAAVAALTRRPLATGVTPIRFLRIGLLLYAASFVVMSTAGWVYAGVIGAVVVFSLAEAFATPMIDTAFTAIPGDRPLVELFNLRQIAVTCGESLGSFSGGALYLLAQTRGATALYWIALGAAGAAMAFAHRWEPIS